MAVIKTETEVIGVLFDGQVWLEGQESKLAYDGDETRKSTDFVDVTDGVLNIMFHGVGIAGTAWKVTINLLEPDVKEFFKKTGSIQSNGHSLIEDSKPLP